MTGHPRAETLELYVDGDLPLAERLRIDTHVAACGRCAAHLDELCLVVEELEWLGDGALPADFAAELAEEASPSREVLIQPLRRGVLLSIALCCAGLLAVCGAMLSFDAPVAGVTDDVLGQVDVLLGSPFQVQAGIFGALAITAVLGLGVIARALASTPAPTLGDRP